MDRRDYLARDVLSVEGIKTRVGIEKRFYEIATS
jgi:hypothetical protein